MAGSDITKASLAQALKQIMAKKPFTKISVGEICERCGMNRKSFYYHFKDKYDLMNWIFDSEFLSAINLADYDTGWDFLSDICRYFYSEREFYKNALAFEGQNSFKEYMQQSLQPIIELLSSDVFDGVEPADFYMTFFSDAFNAAILRWLSEGGSLPPDVFLARLKTVILNFSREALDKLS